MSELVQCQSANQVTKYVSQDGIGMHFIVLGFGHFFYGTHLLVL